MGTSLGLKQKVHIYTHSRRGRMRIEQEQKAVPHLSIAPFPQHSQQFKALRANLFCAFVDAVLRDFKFFAVIHVTRKQKHNEIMRKEKQEYIWASPTSNIVLHRGQSPKKYSQLKAAGLLHTLAELSLHM